jgi:brefeldin A-inhibited guanine nucleotide-exchange protein
LYWLTTHDSAGRTQLRSLLQALSTLDAATFQAELARFFPVLTKLMTCDYATADVQRALSELFLVRVGPMLPALAQHQR